MSMLTLVPTTSSAEYPNRRSARVVVEQHRPGRIDHDHAVERRVDHSTEPALAESGYRFGDSCRRHGSPTGWLRRRARRPMSVRIPRLATLPDGGGLRRRDRSRQRRRSTRDGSDRFNSTRNTLTQKGIALHPAREQTGSRPDARAVQRGAPDMLCLSPDSGDRLQAARRSMPGESTARKSLRIPVSVVLERRIARIGPWSQAQWEAVAALAGEELRVRAGFGDAGARGRRVPALSVARPGGGALSGRLRELLVQPAERAAVPLRRPASRGTTRRTKRSS